ncbi:MAG: patatin-like phospholipase family protein [Anaerolineales bacterium]|nr:patatin-like phospholipase family protein [Anaerolineales bacterium]
MKYDMVFEGGGAKGMVFVGAMQEFEARGHTHDRLLGTSAGAITAALLAAGYRSDEMMEALAEKKGGKSVFSDFMGDPGSFSGSPLVRDGALAKLLTEIDIPLIPDAIEKRLDRAILNWMASSSKANHLFSFVELGGWYSADNFLKWISRKLDSGEYNGKSRNFSNMTLKQFHAATGKDLSLVGSDTSMEMMLVLNHRTAPELPVVWAVRMSMSIPLLWQEVVWQKEWGTYRGMEMEGHTIVDGGLLSNFPIELFISDLKTVTSVMGDKTSQNVLGMLIDETLPVPGVQSAKGDVEKDKFEISQLATVQRLNHLVNTVLSARDKSVIEAFENLVARMPAKNYGTTEFDMTDERRNILVDAGQKAMEEYFDKRQSAVAFAIDMRPDPAAKNTANKLADRMLR